MPGPFGCFGFLFEDGQQPPSNELFFPKLLQVGQGEGFLVMCRMLCGRVLKGSKLLGVRTAHIWTLLKKGPCPHHLYLNETSCGQTTCDLNLSFLRLVDFLLSFLRNSLNVKVRTPLSSKFIGASLVLKWSNGGSMSGGELQELADLGIKLEARQRINGH